jgi:hypothetical protein
LNERDIRSRGNVKVANATNAIQSILEGSKRGRLWQQHQETVKAFVEVWVFFRLQKLESKI